jgi:hypothetical protein
MNAAQLIDPFRDKVEQWAARSHARRRCLFTIHFYLYREAPVALRRQGDTSGAAYAAASAESLLSELLLHAL